MIQNWVNESWFVHRRWSWLTQRWRASIQDAGGCSGKDDRVMYCLIFIWRLYRTFPSTISSDAMQSLREIKRSKLYQTLRKETLGWVQRLATCECRKLASTLDGLDSDGVGTKEKHQDSDWLRRWVITNSNNMAAGSAWVCFGTWKGGTGGTNMCGRLRQITAVQRTYAHRVSDE